jgi:hypothetical protein
MPLSARRRTPRANALIAPPQPPSNHPLPAFRHSAGRPLDRPPRCFPVCLSALSSDSLSLLSSRLLLHCSSSTPSLYQLLPVPGPDPARAPLWCLGGVRARHRPQPPYPSRTAMDGGSASQSISGSRPAHVRYTTRAPRLARGRCDDVDYRERAAHDRKGDAAGPRKNGGPPCVRAAKPRPAGGRAARRERRAPGRPDGGG